MDELVKDYLIFRGFHSTLKTLEIELKNDKDKSFRVSLHMFMFSTKFLDHQCNLS